VSDKEGRSAFPNSEKNKLGKKRFHPPRVLDYEPQVVVRGKFDSFLDIARRSGVDPDYWHVSLLARDAERGVEVAALDRPVRKGVRLVVCVFGSARLIGTPDTVVPAGENIRTVAGGRVVARCGGWDGMDQWLRDF